MPNVQIPLIGSFTSLYSSIDTPDTTADPPDAPYYLNGYFEVNIAEQEEARGLSSTYYTSKRHLYCKRPGLEKSSFVSLAFPNNYKIQGQATNFDKTKLAFYINNGTTAQVWFYNGSSFSTSLAGTWTLTSSVVFTELDGISYGTNNLWAVTDFVNGGLLTNAGVFSTISDTDFTSLALATNFVAMDGYLFIGTTNNRIYNSDLNTPTSWTATSFLSASDTPGNVLWLHKIKNYLVVFKDKSLEFFENTGNPAPGSPLTAQKQLNVKIGLASRSSVKEVSDGVIFLGISTSGKVGVYKISKDNLQIKEISNQFIQQVVGQYSPSNTSYHSDSFVAGVAGGEAQVLIYRGKELYALNIRTDTVDRTWVYDNDLDTWYRWASCMTGDDVLDNLFTPSQAMTYRSGGTLYTLMAQNFFSDSTHPPYLAQFNPLGANFGDTNNAGVLHSYPLIWVSDVLDFGTRKRKFMDSFEVIHDGFAGDGSGLGPNMTLTVYYRDYTYTQSRYVTRTVSYATNTSSRARITRLGSFRKRSFVIKQTDNNQFLPFRLWGIEVSLNVGETDSVPSNAKQIVQALGEIYSNKNLGLNVRTFTTDSTLNVSDAVAICVGNLTLTLPPANSWSSRTVSKSPVIIVASTTGTITLAASGSDTISGTGSAGAGLNLILTSDGSSNWYSSPLTITSGPYVLKAGDTMSGALGLGVTPSLTGTSGRGTLYTSPIDFGGVASSDLALYGNCYPSNPGVLIGMGGTAGILEISSIGTSFWNYPSVTAGSSLVSGVRNLIIQNDGRSVFGEFGSVFSFQGVNRRLEIQSMSGQSSNTMFYTNDYSRNTTGTGFFISFGAASGNTYADLSCYTTGGTVLGSINSQSNFLVNPTSDSALGGGFILGTPTSTWWAIRRTTTGNNFTIDGWNGSSAQNYIYIDRTNGHVGLSRTPTNYLLEVNGGIYTNLTATTVPPANLFNNINISETGVQAGSDSEIDGIRIQHTLNGATRGSRNSFVVLLTQNVTSNLNTSRFYCAAAFIGYSPSGDGGILGSEAGAVFGCNPIVSLDPSATHMVNASAMEVNTNVQSGASVLYKSGIQIAGMATDKVQGSTWDAMISLSGIAGSVGWKNGILFSNANGAYPLSSTGALIATSGSTTVTTGIDISSFTYSGNHIKTPNYFVAGTGFGYQGTGTGGTVTQATSKSTAVTLNKVTGTITTNAAALAAGTIVSFTLNNTNIATGDALILNHAGGGTIGAYTFEANCGAGIAVIFIRNNTAGSLSEGLIIKFILVKGVNA